MEQACSRLTLDALRNTKATADDVLRDVGIVFSQLLPSDPAIADLIRRMTAAPFPPRAVPRYAKNLQFGPQSVQGWVNYGSVSLLSLVYWQDYSSAFLLDREAGPPGNARDSQQVKNRPWSYGQTNLPTYIHSCGLF